MRIGAMSAYGMQPYIYNTNALSGASMNRLSGIPDDVLERKVAVGREYQSAAEGTDA